ncbi:MAG: hypothetical protein QOI03_2339 [Solirubrobacteraceae bacterium]|nr:hypothetical protein [Solirubrobacteraceae bacterium]
MVCTTSNTGRVIVNGPSLAVALVIHAGPTSGCLPVACSSVGATDPVNPVRDPECALDLNRSVHRP